MENDPPSAMPPNGPGINVGLSMKLRRAEDVVLLAEAVIDAHVELIHVVG